MKIDKDLALLYGTMLGDGCLGRYKRKDRKNSYHHLLILTCSAIDDKPFLNDIVIPILSGLTQRKIIFKERKDCRAVEIRVYDKDLFSKLNKLGFPIGKKGPNVTIPNVFYEKDLLKYIIQGFFATDGCLCLTKNPNKFYPRVESHTTHKDLMLQIYNYLVNVGMKGHFYNCKFKPDPRWKIVQKQYKFQFNGKKNFILFRDIIGFVNSKHEVLFKNFINYSNEYDDVIKGTPCSSQHLFRLNVDRNYFRKKCLRPGLNRGPRADP